MSEKETDKNILDECRKQITAIDEQIVNLLHQRANVSLKVGAYKKNAGNLPILQPEREAALLEHLLTIDGAMPKEALREIYTYILATSRALQTNVRTSQG